MFTVLFGHTRPRIVIVFRRHRHFTTIRLRNRLNTRLVRAQVTLRTTGGLFNRKPHIRRRLPISTNTKTRRRITRIVTHHHTQTRSDNRRTFSRQHFNTTSPTGLRINTINHLSCTDNGALNNDNSHVNLVDASHTTVRLSPTGPTVRHLSGARRPQTDQKT